MNTRNLGSTRTESALKHNAAVLLQGSLLCLAAALLGLMLSGRHAVAATTDLATVPLATATPTVVKPNVMFILDDSGSMGWEYLPDSVNSNNGRRCYRNNSYNGVYYNPNLTYALPLDANGVAYPAASFTAASTDGFTAGAATTDLSNGFMAGNDGAGQAAYYYAYTGATPATPVPNTCYADTSYTKVTISPPISTITVGGNGSTSVSGITVSGAQILAAPVAASSSSSTLATNIATQINRCTRTIAGNCTVVGYTASAAGSVVTIAGPDTASGTPVVSKSGNKTFTATAFTAGSNASQKQNFANWYSYYRTRMLMMKSAAGIAFNQLDNNYRVGFITINPGAPVQASNYLPIATYDAAQKTAWYNILYSQVPASSTPLRTALARVGRYYGGKHDGINAGMADDPVQYSCQQNFAILTTDGYWNETTSGANQPQLDGVTAVGNQDNVNQTVAPIYSSRATGTYDGGLAGATNTLSDVAMYYYKTDLRPTGSTNLLGTDVSANNVLASTLDFATHQHMTTFTLGLMSGTLTYRPDYETATSGDFYSIKQGTLNWPLPVSNTITNLDDLWHAAVNGRGTFFSAGNPQALSDGLAGALAGVAIRAGAGAAVATSSPNITASDNRMYASTYRSGKWDGDLVSQQIDATTGAIIATTAWSAQAQLDSVINTAAANGVPNPRTIYTYSSSGATHLKPFNWANLTVAEQAYFTNKCGLWSQCNATDMIPSDMVIGNNGQNLVNYLRGDFTYEMRATNTSQVFRARDHVLGDTINAKPVFVKVPQHSFADAVTPTYDSFKTANASRQGVAYVAANDGMLHAFNTDTGAELWAYLPKMVMPNLYLLAEQNYATNHQYFVDGSPEVMDVFDATSSSWRTLLVGGLAGGGRGYYALDITDPAAPHALWEICSDSTLCANSDTDMGYSYGNPVITKRASDGRWVVLLSSGYNNVTPGTGHGIIYVLDALTGVVLNKLDTGAGTATTPSGLTKISAWADNSATDNTTKWVYGGDLNGDMWRFDLTVATPTVTQIAALRDAAGVGQPVTVRPELGLVSSYPVVFVGTGKFLGTSDLTTTQLQSVYAFRDTSANLGNLRARADMVQQTLTQASPTTRTVSNNAVDWSVNKGWYMDLNPANATPRERVNIDPQLINGTLLVFSNIPSSDACTVAGTSWLYQLNYLSGAAPASAANQQGGQQVSTSLTAGATAVMLPDGSIKVIVTDTTGNKTPVNVNTSGGGTAAGRRVSWRELTP